MSDQTETRRKSCSWCRFFKPNINPEPQMDGNCRRRPPVWVAMEGGFPMCSFPSVSPQDWCGEWDSRSG